MNTEKNRFAHIVYFSEGKILRVNKLRLESSDFFFISVECSDDDVSVALNIMMMISAIG